MRQGTIIVEVCEEVVLYISADITEIKTSLRKDGQSSIPIELVKEIISCWGDIAGIEASGREAR